MFRRSLLSTVFWNTADAGGGGAPKPEDAPGGAAAPGGEADAAAAAAGGAPDPAAAPAAAGDAAPAVVGDAAKPAEGAAAADAGGEPKKDFAAETLLTGEEPKPGDPPKDAPKPEDKPAAPDAKPGEAAPADPAKPEEKPGDAAAKADDQAPPAPKEAPVYTYEFGEGLKIDDAALKPVNETFAKHNISPETARELMGMHVEQMKSYAAQVAEDALKSQRDVWATTRGQWRDEIRGDEQIGGAAYETNLRRAAEVRDRLVPANQMAAFNRMLLVTGVGDHPEFIRFCVNAHRFVGEPGIPAQAGNPAKHNGQPGGRRRLRDMY
jgi:hypothetical protein